MDEESEITPAMSRERHAYMCEKPGHDPRNPSTVTTYRLFLSGRPKVPPVCPRNSGHGRMQRQANEPYMRKKGG